MRVELDLVLFEIGEELVGAEDLADLDELIVVVVPMEEGFLAEDLRRRNDMGGWRLGWVRGLAAHHGREHAAQAPHVEAVVVLLEVDEQLGALEVTRRDTDIVGCSWMIEFRQTPVDQAELRTLIRNDSTDCSRGTGPAFRLS